MINPLNSHYSFTNPASIYDEEALTALELAGRTAAKTNEVVKDQNDLRNETETHLENQDKTIDDRMNTQDDVIEYIRTVTVPQDVSEEVQRQITNGTFDGQIDKSLNNLNDRVDNLLGSVTQGTTTLDAEVIDLRVDANGVTHTNAGNAVRETTKDIAKPIKSTPHSILPSGSNPMTLSNIEGVCEIEYTTKGDQSEQYIGCGLPLNLTQTQLLGRKVIVIFHEEPAPVIYITNNSNSWGAQYPSFVKKGNTNKCVEFLIDDSIDLGTNKLWCLFEFTPYKARPIIHSKFSVYVTNVLEGCNIVPFSLHSISTEPIISVPHATSADNAGWSNLNYENYTHKVSKNTGNVVYDGLNTFTLTVKNCEPEGQTYTAFSINVTQYDSLKGVLIESEGDITNLHLTQSFNNWQNKILDLKTGYNDLSHLNREEYEHILITVGVYSQNRTDKEGKVKIYCIPKTEVIATRFLSQENYVTFNDIDSYIPKKEIVCWGDSLTAGGGWTSTLQSLSGYTVYNGGTGGENVRTITARQGADVMMVNNITIPADTTPVKLADYNQGLTTQFGYKATPLLQGGAHVNPVSIKGVLGTLKFTGSAWNDTSGTWTFTRQTAGEQVVIDRPTAIVTAFDRERNNPHLMVIFMGQNGGYDDLDDLVQSHKLMIEHSRANHVVILGLSSGSASSRAEYETRMIKEFGRYFISLRDYLSKYGLADAGLTPTEADTTAMSTGTVPPQLFTDGIHFTAACKTVIGNMLYKKCCELNIF